MCFFRPLQALMIGGLMAAITLPASAQQPPARAIPDRPQPTPFTERAQLQNGRDVQRALISAYPRELREALIGGTVVVDIFVDETGRVLRALIAGPTESRPTPGSSGLPALDAAALAVASVMRFSPGLNDGVPVGVWIEFPITFKVG
jgi:TonB family protein